MKKILYSIIILSLILTVTLSYGSKVKAETYGDIQQDYKKTMALVKAEIEKGNASSPEDVQAYKDFMQKYPEKDINALMEKNLKANLNEASQVTSKQELGKNDKSVNQLSDGSLVVAESTDSEDTSENTGGITTYAAKKTKSGKSHVSRFTYTVYGPHPVAKLKNTTRYKVYKTKVKITSVSAQGSSSFYPAKLTKLKSKKLGNNTRTASGITNFKYTAGLPGKEFLRKYPSVTTKIKIKSHKGKTVRYSVTHKTRGI
ncbi:hypothetical protein [Staphylococcus haemolyticus]|uniref:hypothetical protein n=1 Tax=Staphylococcus haemolyticus TaxID=1283 RepID=UPI0034D52BBF